MATILDSRWHLFLKVADFGSISGASVALDLPQSVVSRQIGQLETEAGTRLFRRTGRGVVLTEFGELVYPRIVTLVREAARLEDEMRTRSGQPMGDVHFGLLPSAVPVLAGPLWSEIRRQWPQVRMHLTEGSSAQLEEWLGQGRLDLAMLLREEDTARPHESLLARVPLDLVVPAGHPIAQRTSIPFAELAGLPLVLPSEPHPLRARLAGLAREKGLTLVHALEADSIRLQHEIVASGGGFAITAGVLAPRETQRLAAVRIVEPALTRAVVLGVTMHRPHTLATRSVADLIRSMAPGLLQPA
jgi:LysR family nitrogen assimilation transcriptional regulator